MGRNGSCTVCRNYHCYCYYNLHNYYCACDCSNCAQVLEKWLETLTVNVIVMVLVLVDCINVLFTMLGSGQDTLQQTIITFVVLGLFLAELSLRMIAQGGRFFKSYWNWFDMVVIYASIGFAVTNHVLANVAAGSPGDGTRGDDGVGGTFETARSSATPLRILSRIAMGLRVMRVMLHMRKARRLQVCRRFIFTSSLLILLLLFYYYSSSYHYYPC